MQKLLLICSLLVAYTLAATNSQSPFSTLWSAWKTIHSKIYTAEEDAARFLIFMDNYRRVSEFNARGESYKLGLNIFADLTPSEFKQKHTGCAYDDVSDQMLASNLLEEDSNLSIPDSFDWRLKGVLSPIKNQGTCGSCWAFSATEAVESYNAITNGQKVTFGPQQIVDCARTAGHGCGGGSPWQAIDYAAQNGLEREDDYPYRGVAGACLYEESKAVKSNTGHRFVRPLSSDSMKAAVLTNPISVLLQADQDVFHLYSSGVIQSGCGVVLDHAVIVAGYGTVDGIDSFIVRNSWGSDWGDKGYVYLSTDQRQNNGAGVCGILSRGVVPV